MGSPTSDLLSPDHNNGDTHSVHSQDDENGQEGGVAGRSEIMRQRMENRIKAQAERSNKKRSKGHNKHDIRDSGDYKRSHSATQEAVRSLSFDNDETKDTSVDNNADQYNHSRRGSLTNSETEKSVDGNISEKTVKTEPVPQIQPNPFGHDTPSDEVESAIAGLDDDFGMTPTTPSNATRKPVTLPPKKVVESSNSFHGTPYRPPPVNSTPVKSEQHVDEPMTPNTIPPSDQTKQQSEQKVPYRGMKGRLIQSHNKTKVTNSPKPSVICPNTQQKVQKPEPDNIIMPSVVPSSLDQFSDEEALKIVETPEVADKIEMQHRKTTVIKGQLPAQVSPKVAHHHPKYRRVSHPEIPAPNQIPEVRRPSVGDGAKTPTVITPNTPKSRLAIENHVPSRKLSQVSQEGSETIKLPKARNTSVIPPATTNYAATSVIHSTPTPPKQNIPMGKQPQTVQGLPGAALQKPKPLSMAKRTPQGTAANSQPVTTIQSNIRGPMIIQRPQNVSSQNVSVVKMPHGQVQTRIVSPTSTGILSPPPQSQPRVVQTQRVIHQVQQSHNPNPSQTHLQVPATPQQQQIVRISQQPRPQQPQVFQISNPITSTGGSYATYASSAGRTQQVIQVPVHANQPQNTYQHVVVTPSPKQITTKPGQGKLQGISL